MINNSSLTYIDYDEWYDEDFDDDFQLPKHDCFVAFEISRFTVSFFTILLNSTLVCFFCREKKLRGTATKTLLFSLAICDLITGFIVCVQTVCYRWRQILRVEVVITVDSFRLFITKVYVMHLCGLTLDRYVSLFCALRYKAIVTKPRKLFYMILAWLIPFVFTSVRVVWLLNFNLIIELWYSVVGFVLFLAIPTALLAVAFLKMFFEIRRIKQTHPFGHAPKLSTSKEFRLVSTFSFMYFTFLIVAMPYFSIRFWINLSALQGESFMLDKGTLQFILVMKDITSIFNPICYTLITPDVRKATFRNWCHRLGISSRIKRSTVVLTPDQLDVSTQERQGSNASSMETCL